MWRTTRLKMCWAGGWFFNRVLSYLCFSVEQGKGNSSKEGPADLSNIVSLFLDSAGNDLIFFPSPYIYNTSVFSRQFFSSDSMGPDSGITSRGWCIHLSPLLRRPSSGPNWYLRKALYRIPYFTDDLNVCRDRHILKSHFTIL